MNNNKALQKSITVLIYGAIVGLLIVYLFAWLFSFVCFIGLKLCIMLPWKLWWRCRRDLCGAGRKWCVSYVCRQNVWINLGNVLLYSWVLYRQNRCIAIYSNRTEEVNYSSRTQEVIYRRKQCLRTLHFIVSRAGRQCSCTICVWHQLWFWFISSRASTFFARAFGWHSLSYFHWFPPLFFSPSPSPRSTKWISVWG